jgi:hypothetical protein
MEFPKMGTWNPRVRVVPALTAGFQEALVKVQEVEVVH